MFLYFPKSVISDITDEKSPETFAVTGLFCDICLQTPFWRRHSESERGIKGFADLCLTAWLWRIFIAMKSHCALVLYSYANRMSSAFLQKNKKR